VIVSVWASPLVRPARSYRTGDPASCETPLLSRGVCHARRLCAASAMVLGAPGLQPSMRLAPHTDGMNILPGRATPSQTLPGAGAWVRGPEAHVRGGVGKPGFPTPLLQQLMFTCDGHAHGAPRRDERDLGARASRPHRGSVGTMIAPSLPLPRWGREPGSSPRRGEAGRGAERGERWSPQPSMRLRRTTPQ